VTIVLEQKERMPRLTITLWALVSVQPGTILITGNKGLIEKPPDSAKMLSPRGLIEFSKI
jgi:hypothetical protein